jgi:hypothetical protein
MTDKLIIKEDENLVRDKQTNAILNTDTDSLQMYKAKRDKERQMQQDILNLKTDMSEIKYLLQKLVTENNK